jgi:hypothetical protein
MALKTHIKMVVKIPPRLKKFLDEQAIRLQQLFPYNPNGLTFKPKIKISKPYSGSPNVLTDICIGTAVVASYRYGEVSAFMCQRYENPQLEMTDAVIDRIIKDIYLTLLYDDPIQYLNKWYEFVGIKTDTGSRKVARRGESRNHYEHFNHFLAPDILLHYCSDNVDTSLVEVFIKKDSDMGKHFCMSKYEYECPTVATGGFPDFVVLIKELNAFLCSYYAPKP